MQNLLHTLVTALVDNESRVSVTTTSNATGGSVLELRVADEDLGKVIGKQGKTARALRQVIGAASRKGGGQRVEVRIVDEKVATPAATS